MYILIIQVTAFIKHRQKMSGFPMKSVLSFWWGNRKSLLIWNPDIFCLCLINFSKYTFYLNYDPYPFCTHFRRSHISNRICAKRVWVIKNKMCVFTIQKPFCSQAYTKKMLGFPMKSVLCFELNGGWKRKGDKYHKTALNQVKMKVFTCGVKKQ